MSGLKQTYYRYNCTGQPMSELSDEQKQELKLDFDAFDEDGSGAIDQRELRVMLKAMGFDHFTKEEVMDMLMEVDEDGSGEIEFPEFAKMMGGKYTNRDPKREILKAFELFEEKDPEFDLMPGKITFEGLRKLADDLGETLTDEEIREMIEEADRTGDGSVSQEEFIRVMRRTGLY
mmetsp:Transcript_7022/g.11316  ORF Transcript_7022/g.11316 Transcript_7022/m.11316 type:complete len:176 (+) Transcript_7022:67-594(+)|eukprot:CAMPEP_0169132116 /NCGR_PEP_ID=MMETSP1015-20121227/38618_1 /TAXON_ID=342587 /ORGANISM="Karlodinium micrum, Strain CCMP2283" /LENGTH=175 /DNA_ID=CAMNT_0009196441 /DNA_START=66 /DNA_END=593 /DNA_ORIENTATION=-